MPSYKSFATHCFKQLKSIQDIIAGLHKGFLGIGEFFGFGNFIILGLCYPFTHTACDGNLEDSGKRKNKIKTLFFLLKEDKHYRSKCPPIPPLSPSFIC